MTQEKGELKRGFAPLPKNFPSPLKERGQRGKVEIPAQGGNDIRGQEKIIWLTGRNWKRNTS
jgi:hypothetical protein